MIASTDLRIGNVFKEKYTNEIIEVICIKSKAYHGADAIYFNGDFEGDWQSEPIKLTPEILEQIGLTKQSDYYVFQTFNNYVSCVELLDVGTGFQVFDTSGVKMCLLEYLHELQNLYYQFNNKQELPIDINALKV